jgi:hypothetical protein
MAANPGQPSGQNLLQRILNIENLLGINGASNALFRVADANGVQRVRIGLLPNGDYGVLFNDTLGNQQELLPTVSSFYAGNLTTSSGSFVTIANSPSVKAYLGASGDAIVSASCNFNVSTSGIVQLLIDGTSPGANAGEILFCILGAPGAVSVAATIKMSNLFQQTFSPNQSHTFTLKYLSGSSSITCAQNSLTVTPI